MSFIFKHKLFAGALVIVVAAALWYFLSGSSAPEAVLSAENPSAPPEAQQLIQSLTTLRTVTLDGAIFSNASFQLLHDFSTQIATEPVGRLDPFAPLSASEIAGGGASAQSNLPVQS